MICDEGMLVKRADSTNIVLWPNLQQMRSFYVTVSHCVEDTNEEASLHSHFARYVLVTVLIFCIYKRNLYC
jgi:hypothetical protein